MLEPIPRSVTPDAKPFESVRALEACIGFADLSLVSLLNPAMVFPKNAGIDALRGSSVGVRAPRDLLEGLCSGTAGSAYVAIILDTALNEDGMTSKELI